MALWTDEQYAGKTITYGDGNGDSDSVSPGSNPGSPANNLLEFIRFSVLDRTDNAEHLAYAGRTKTGTVLLRTQYRLRRLQMTTTREMIQGWLNRGREKGATHMIVVCDTFDHGDYPVFVEPGQDAKEVSKQYDNVNMQRLMEVYNLALPDQEQLAQRRVWNW